MFNTKNDVGSRFAGAASATSSMHNRIYIATLVSGLYYQVYVVHIKASSRNISRYHHATFRPFELLEGEIPLTLSVISMENVDPLLVKLGHLSLAIKENQNFLAFISFQEKTNELLTLFFVVLDYD